jgi:hypothetical protein
MKSSSNRRESTGHSRPKTETAESRLSYEDRVLKKLLETPPVKRKGGEKKKPDR